MAGNCRKVESEAVITVVIDRVIIAGSLESA